MTLTIRMARFVTAAALSTLALLLVGCTEDDGPVGSTRLVRTQLSNGVTVIVQPVTGVTRVGVEFMYRVGFLDEPEGRPQLAHFMEHLILKSPTATYRAGESWNMLQEKGTSNAETMPTFTHYDYGVAARDLEMVLELEVDRLMSLRLDSEVNAREASYCYSELEALQQMEIAPLIKFATMAAHQSWRFGGESATVLAGLESIPHEEIAAFYRSRYHPGNLAIIITGGVSSQRAIELVRKHFEGLSLPEPEPAVPIDWSSRPPVARVLWDSTVPGVFVWFEPPEDEIERTVLSLWGTLVRGQLIEDVEISAVARFVAGPDHVWSVGRLPYFVYVSVAEGYNTEQAYRALGDRLERIVGELANEFDISQFKSLISQLEIQGRLGGQTVDAQLQYYTQQRGLNENQGLERIFLQHSINLGVRDLLLGENIDRRLADLRRIDGDQLVDIVTRALDPAKRRVTILEPTAAAGP